MSDLNKEDCTKAFKEDCTKRKKEFQKELQLALEDYMQKLQRLVDFDDKNKEILKKWEELKKNLDEARKKLELLEGKKDSIFYLFG